MGTNIETHSPTFKHTHTHGRGERETVELSALNEVFLSNPSPESSGNPKKVQAERVYIRDRGSGGLQENKTF